MERHLDKGTRRRHGAGRRDHRGPYGAQQATAPAGRGFNHGVQGDYGPGYPEDHGRFDQARTNPIYDQELAKLKDQASRQEPGPMEVDRPYRGGMCQVMDDGPKPCRETSLSEQVDGLYEAVFSLQAHVGLVQREALGLVAIDKSEFQTPPVKDGDQVDQLRHRVQVLRGIVERLEGVARDNTMHIEDHNRRLG